jgi:hypothetical protein
MEAPAVSLQFQATPRDDLTALSILIRVQFVTGLHDLFLIMSIGYIRFFKTFDKWPLFIFLKLALSGLYCFVLAGQSGIVIRSWRAGSA